MRIAVLAWGSLIKYPTKRGVTLRLASEWALSSLTLPVEFSRVSGLKADSPWRFLSLVIDDRRAVRRIPVYFAQADHSELEPAVQNLAGREGLIRQIRKIGRTDRDTRVPRIGRRIKRWGKANGFDAVIWTDLEPNFSEELGHRFTLPTAVRFLRSISPAEQQIARDYVNDAPEETATRLRARLKEIGWLDPVQSDGRKA